MLRVVMDVSASTGCDEPRGAGAGEVVFGEVTVVGQRQPDRLAQCIDLGRRGSQSRGPTMQIVGVLGDVHPDDEVVIGAHDLAVVALDRSTTGALHHQPGFGIGQIYQRAARTPGGSGSPSCPTRPARAPRARRWGPRRRAAKPRRSTLPAAWSRWARS